MSKKIILLLFIISFQQSITMGSNYNVYSNKDYFSHNINSKERIEFIVDFSTSMIEKIDGERKIDIAISTLEKILRNLPKDMYIGFRAYGYRSGMTFLDSCRVSKLISPVVPNNNYIIQASLYELHPFGSTPITFSLKQAIKKDFGDFSGKKRIILLTDGAENCDESPCEYALQLIQSRSDIRIDVIAFNIYDDEAIKQLKCVALATSGKFYSVKTAAELLDSFNDSLNIKKEVQGVLLP